MTMVQTYKNSYMLKIISIKYFKYFWYNAQQEQENYILSSDYGLQHIQVMFLSYRIKQTHNLLCTFVKPCCVKIFFSLNSMEKTMVQTSICFAMCCIGLKS